MKVDGADLDLTGVQILPGLINAHDHLLHFALFPRLGSGPYANATEWARDIYHPDRDPVRKHFLVPKHFRSIWGRPATWSWRHHSQPSRFLSPRLRRKLRARDQGIWMGALAGVHWRRAGALRHAARCALRDSPERRYGRQRRGGDLPAQQTRRAGRSHGPGARRRHEARGMGSSPDRGSLRHLVPAVESFHAGRTRGKRSIRESHSRWAPILPSLPRAIFSMNWTTSVART